MVKQSIPYAKKYQSVLGLEMAYLDEGSGNPIVFLHGNPTSSYLWREIIPYVQNFGRCIAPDLIGMGDSEKIPHSGPDSYTFVENRRYLDALLAQLGVCEQVTFVVHDWGAALGFDWAYRHPDAVKGIAYMEGIIKPRSWSELPERGRKIFQALRSEDGEQMVLEHNSFIETNLPIGILRKLTEEDMTEYRRPFSLPGEGRRPTLTWPRQLPFDGYPADVTDIVTTYGEWMAESSFPKLFVNCDPGTMPTSHVEFCRTWSMQTEITVRGLHYPQEDSPQEIGEALAAWLKDLT